MLYLPDLPDEVLLAIFTCIPLGRQKVVMRLTCKRWMRLLDTPAAHESIDVEESYPSSVVMTYPNEGAHYAFTECHPLRWRYHEYQGEIWLHRKLNGSQINEAIQQNMSQVLYLLHV